MASNRAGAAVKVNLAFELTVRSGALVHPYRTRPKRPTVRAGRLTWKGWVRPESGDKLRDPGSHTVTHGNGFELPTVAAG